MTAITGLVLGGFNLFAISRVLNGGQILTFKDDKSAFISAFVVAIIMCGMGIATTVPNSQMRIPGFILGATLGIVNILLFFFVVTEREIPIIGTVRNGLIVLMVIMASKMAMTIGIWIQGSLGGNV